MSYHNKIMNLRTYAADLPYRQGHRDARHDAAELALEADATIDELLEALEDALQELETMSYSHYESLERKIRAAITKARGEQ